MAQTLQQPLQVGQQAPDFTLKDTAMEPVSLHDFRGQTVILAFFPAAFSGTCTKELCTFRDALAQFNQAHAQVLGISVDLPYALRRFKENERLDFPLLSDFDQHVIKEYGIVDHDFHGFTGGVAQRSIFVVGPDGKIAWEWVAEKPSQQPDYARVLQEAEKLA